MQAAIERTTLKLYKNTDDVNYLLSMLSKADANIRNDIENRLVRLGTKAVPALVNCVTTNKGIARGVAAMCLIRIGAESIPFLKEADGWIANYLISEIA